MLPACATFSMELICIRDYMALLLLSFQEQTPDVQHPAIVLQWQGINLRSTALGRTHSDNKKRTALFSIFPINHNSDQPWYTDISSQVLRAMSLSLGSDD